MRLAPSAEETPPSDLLIPEFLIARTSNVKRHWKALTKRLLSGESWADVMAGERFVPITSNPYAIVLRGPLSEADDDEQILLYPVLDHLADTAGRNFGAQREAVRHLILAGMDQPWFALCILAAPPQLYPPRGNGAEEREDAERILRSVALWWPEMCSIQSRYLGSMWFEQPWPRWALAIFPFCREAGMERHEIDAMVASPERAGEILRRRFLSE